MRTRFTELGADFAAAIRGMPKEDLLSQEVRQQRRALTLGLVGSGIAAAFRGSRYWGWRFGLLGARRRGSAR